MIDVDDACAQDVEFIVSEQFGAAEVHRTFTSELIQFAVLNHYVEEHFCVRESAKALAMALRDRNNPVAVVHVSRWGADSPDDRATAWAADYEAPRLPAPDQVRQPETMAQSAADAAAIRAVEEQLGAWEGPRPGGHPWIRDDPDGLGLFTRIVTVTAQYVARARDIVDGQLREGAPLARVGEYEFFDWADGPDCGGGDLEVEAFETDEDVRDLTTGAVVFGPTRPRQA